MFKFSIYYRTLEDATKFVSDLEDYLFRHEGIITVEQLKRLSHRDNRDTGYKFSWKKQFCFIQKYYWSARENNPVKYTIQRKEPSEPGTHLQKYSVSITTEPIPGEEPSISELYKELTIEILGWDHKSRTPLWRAAVIIDDILAKMDKPEDPDEHQSFADMIRDTKKEMDDHVKFTSKF